MLSKMRSMFKKWRINKKREKELDLLDASLDEHFDKRNIFYEIAEKHHGDEIDFDEKYFNL